MTVQTVPYALQNASHSAALFRQAQSAAFVTGGALGGLELLVTQQASPNMSVILGPGRAKIPGTAVSPPVGQTWTTQAMYDSLNDADTTLTVAASNPSNPRIDVVYMGINDSFYSGALNTAVAGVVTGTPAPSPVAPAVPTNAIAVARIAVGAGVTSIVNANISRVVSTVKLIGGAQSVADLAALPLITGSSEPDQVYVDALNCLFIYDSGTWTQAGTAVVANAATRDTEYAKAAAAYRVNGAVVYLLDSHATQVFNGTAWRGVGGQMSVVPTSAVNGTVAAGGAVTFSAVTSVSINGCFTTDYDNYAVVYDFTTSAAGALNPTLRLAGTDAATAYDTQRFTSVSTASTSTQTLNAANWVGSNGVGIVNASQSGVLNLFTPALAVATRGWIENNITANPMTTSSVLYVASMLHRTLTAYDGITFSISTGTMTGTIRIYGWNNN